MIFCGVLASGELLKNGGRFTTPSKVPVPSVTSICRLNLPGQNSKVGVMSGLATILPGLQFKVEPVATSASACGLSPEDPYAQADRRTWPTYGDG
jgi:hypothetical protein